MNKPVLHLDVFASAAQWRLWENQGVLMISARATDVGGMNESGVYRYTYAELAAFEPRLAQLVKEVAANDQLPGTLIEVFLSASAYLWKAPHWRFVDSDAAGREHVIHDFTLPQTIDAASNLKTEVLVLRVKVTPAGFEYARQFGYENLVLPKAWMDRHFPGAIERLRGAMALGLVAPDLVALIHAPAPVDNLPLTGSFTT